jgi:hypothetical protein
MNATVQSLRCVIRKLNIWARFAGLGERHWVL